MPPTDHAVLAFLEHQPNLAVLPVDLEVARAAARIRAAHRFAPPDALVIGTAIAEGIRHLVTNDYEWRRKLEGLPAGGGGGFRVVTLAEHLAAG
jgi:predicted nucleic acid-binding protein